MATNYITIKGYIRDGKIEVDLPENVVDGEVSLEVPITANAPDSTDHQPLTDEEIDALMHPNPKTGAEIAKSSIGSWEHKGITDSVEWIAEQRRQRRKNIGW